MCTSLRIFYSCFFLSALQTLPQLTSAQYTPLSAAGDRAAAVIEHQDGNGRADTGKGPSPPITEGKKEHTSGDDSEATVHSTSDDNSPTTPRSASSILVYRNKSSTVRTAKIVREPAWPCIACESAFKHFDLCTGMA